MTVRHLHLLLSMPAGLVFVAAGTAKAVDVPSFLAAVTEITGAPAGLALLIGLTVIGLEILGGLLLLSRRHLRGTATTLAGLVLVFLLLPPDVSPGSCNCFGPLTPAISTPAHHALNLLLLNILAVIALIGPGWRTVKTAGVLLLVGVDIAVALPPGEPDLALLLVHASRCDTRFASEKGPRAVLVLDFTDFTCPPCYDDILQTVDTLSRFQEADGGHRVVLLVRRKEWSAERAEARARRWTAAAGISLSSGTIADTLLGANSGSFVAAFDRRGLLVRRMRFPLRDGERPELLRLLYPARAGSAKSPVEVLSRIGYIGLSRDHTTCTSQTTTNIRSRSRSASRPFSPRPDGSSGMFRPAPTDRPAGLFPG